MNHGIIAINAIDVVFRERMEELLGKGQGADECRREVICSMKVEYIERVAKARHASLVDGVQSFEMALAAAELSLFLAWASEEE